MSNCVIKGFCNACDGKGVLYVWTGEVDEDDNFVDPVETDCPHCDGGVVQVSTVDIPQLDDILDKCNDVLDKCNDIFEKVSEKGGN